MQNPKFTKPKYPPKKLQSVPPDPGGGARRALMKGLLVACFVMVAFALVIPNPALAQSVCPPAGATKLRVGPENPNNGFALWFLDTNGVGLQLCLDGPGGVVGGICAFDPPLATPFSQQIGFGAEAFWWRAETALSTPRMDALIVMAVEAAFLNEEPIDGEQFPFTRLRIRLDVPVVGTYTVTHPYGVEVYEVDAIGPGHEIRVSHDLEAAGFDTEHQGRVGPFLVWDPAESDPPADYVGDGLTPHTVVGSPCNTNLFRVQGPLGSNLDGLGGDVVETNLFVVEGKLGSGTVGTPATIARATYARDGAGGRIDVFANSLPTAELTVSGEPPFDFGPVTMSHDPDTDRFFASVPFIGAPPLPGAVHVNADASGQIDPGGFTYVPMSRSRPLVDEVTIGTASYDTATGTLLIEGASGDLAAPPVLTVPGLGDLVAGSLARAIDAPPPQVTVVSTTGGKSSRDVAIAPAVVGNSIAVQQARFKVSKDSVSVIATSAYGPTADLEMEITNSDNSVVARKLVWNADKQRWQRLLGGYLSKFTSLPVSVRVFGPEGSVVEPIDTVNP